MSAPTVVGWRWAAGLALVAVLAGCGGAAGSPSPAASGFPAVADPTGTPVATPTAEVTATPAPTPTPTATPTPAPASPMEGIVVRVDSAGLGDVRGFDLRTDRGEIVRFALGPLENASEFPPSHLVEHMAAADRLRIDFEVQDGELVAYRIEHAH